MSNTNLFQNEETLKAILRSDFSYFIQKSFYTITGGEAYHHNWHIDVIADALQKCIDGNIKRLIINVPPRYMKSICASVAFPAWILGRQPNAKVICASYNQDLADKLGFDTLNLMESQWYKDIFPTRLHSQAQSKNDFYTTNQGFRLATSIGGTLTGRGGNFIIIDDPIKPGDASSDTQIKKVNDWYSHTLLSRLDNKHEGVIIVVMQRIHEEDLTGFLIDTDVNNEWMQIKIPAIAEQNEEWHLKNSIYQRKTGEVIHPARESAKHLEDLKGKLGSYVFAGQYQQSPMPIDGNIIKKHHLHRYNKLPTDPELIIQTWDTASKIEEHNDYSVGLTCLVKDGLLYAVGVVREKLEYTQLKEKIRQTHKFYKDKYNCFVAVIIEDKASGIPLIQELRQKGDIVVYAHDVYTNKTHRLVETHPKIENGTILFPEQAPWLTDYENELLRFPNGRYDDQVDATSMMLEGVQYGVISKLKRERLQEREKGNVRCYGVGKVTRLPIEDTLRGRNGWDLIY